jgi:hypothetical protein
VLTQLLLYRTYYLPRKGKATGLLLGEDQVVVQGDLEAATGAFDQPRFDTELILDLFRQTGGTRVVVSDGAVLDGEGLGGLGHRG